MNGVFIHEKQNFRSRAFQRFSTWTYIFIYTLTQFSLHWIKLRRRKRFDIHLLTKMSDIVLVILPFKDQRSADFVWKQLKDLGNNIGNPIQTVFTSPKIGEKLRIQDRKPPVVCRQCVVYQFKCDLCDTDYIGYTTRQLHTRIEEHRATAVGAHVKGCHGISNPELPKQFSVLKEMPGKAAKCFSSVWGNRSWTHNRTQFARKYLFRTF